MEAFPIHIREDGQGLTEYILILVLLVISVIGAVALFGEQIGLHMTTALDPFQGDSDSTYYDDFNGTSNLDWQFIWGKWENEDGRMVSNKRWAKAVAAVGGPDYTYSVDLQTLQPGQRHIWEVSRVVFRFQSTENYYALVPKTDGVLELAKMQDGQWRPWLAYAKTGADPTQVHNYKVRVVGNHIQVWMDNQLYIDYQDPNPIPDGGVGVTNEQSSGAFDNVQVTMEP